MTQLDLPVIDLGDALDDGRRPAFDAALHDALSAWGFVAVTGHGVPVALLERAYAQAAAFFAQPDAVKRRWERPEIGRQRGYTGFGVEHAKDRTIHDLKEFWQVGRALGAAHPLVASGAMPDDVMPETPDGFADTFRALYEALDGFANTLLAGIARGLGLDAGALQEAVREGNSVLRVIHYPPLRPTDPPDAVRAAAHEDINLLTVLPASTQPGLELLDKHGVWRAVVTPPHVMVCDTGDLMQRLTGGALPSVTHRVVNPPGSSNVARFSMPFFCHPRPDWVIRPIDGSEPIVAGEFLQQRLRENRVL